MVAEIISVGTELLLGQIVNTDAQFLSIQLSELGIDVYNITTVGDNDARLKSAVSQALTRADIIITSGGLGPTEDDLTKQTISDLLGLELILDQNTKDTLISYFSNRNYKMTENNLRQAYFPKGCTILHNGKGTAPGCLIETNNKLIFILPGPPGELQPMFLHSVKPVLEEKSNDKIVSRVLRIFGMGESAVEDALKELIDTQTNPSLATYAGFGEVTLRLTAKLKKDEDENLLLDPLEEKVRKIIGNYIYGYGNSSLANECALLLKELDIKISVAESLTGGLLTSSLVDISGISSQLLEGVVSYSNASKIKRLGVLEGTIFQYGAVSQETALEMAEGILKATGADIALSTTGYAGPQTGDEEVGLVYIGIADRCGSYSKEFHFRWTDRERIRKMAVYNALNMLRLHLLERKKAIELYK